LPLSPPRDYSLSSSAINSKGCSEKKDLSREKNKSSGKKGPPEMLLKT